MRFIVHTITTHKRTFYMLICWQEVMCASLVKLICVALFHVQLRMSGWILWCDFSCGKCKNGAFCDNTTGDCHNGCQENWLGSRCDSKFTKTIINL